MTGKTKAQIARAEARQAKQTLSFLRIKEEPYTFNIQRFIESAKPRQLSRTQYLKNIRAAAEKAKPQGFILPESYQKALDFERLPKTEFDKLLEQKARIEQFEKQLRTEERIKLEFTTPKQRGFKILKGMEGEEIFRLGKRGDLIIVETPKKIKVIEPESKQFFEIFKSKQHLAV